MLSIFLMFIYTLTGWLEPLLSEIHKDKSNVVTPVIDTIDDNTLEQFSVPVEYTSIGGFNWNLVFTWHSVPERVLKDHNDTVHKYLLLQKLISSFSNAEQC